MKYSIGAFAEATGLSVDTLRYYDRAGLLHPARSSSGYREYTDQDLSWAAFVLRLRSTGMPIREIAEYAKLREQGDGTMPERLEMLEKHEETLAAQLEALCENMAALRGKIAWYRTQIAVSS